jgi:16S rRNA U516 pseudouridylate synthase RsuA-like enzyme
VELELTVAEGRHRIVRRLAESLGLKVEWLHRVTYGPVRLGRLAEARYRALTAAEIRAIDRLGAGGDGGHVTGRRARIER